VSDYNKKLELGPRPICPQCGVNERKFNSYNKDGSPRFTKLCRVCNGAKERQREYDKKRKHTKTHKYGATYERKVAELTCDKCGFKAEDKCQLDVDHIDGDHNNNEQSNLQILCANCHRLKTKVNKEGFFHENHPYIGGNKKRARK